MSKPHTSRAHIARATHEAAMGAEKNRDREAAQAEHETLTMLARELPRLKAEAHDRITPLNVAKKSLLREAMQYEVVDGWKIGEVPRTKGYNLYMQVYLGADGRLYEGTELNPHRGSNPVTEEESAAGVVGEVYISHFQRKNPSIYGYLKKLGKNGLEAPVTHDREMKIQWPNQRDPNIKPGRLPLSAEAVAILRDPAAVERQLQDLLTPGGLPTVPAPPRVTPIAPKEIPTIPVTPSHVFASGPLPTPPATPPPPAFPPGEPLPPPAPFGPS